MCRKGKKKFWKEKDDCVCSANTQGISEMFTGNFVKMQRKPDSLGMSPQDPVNVLLLF